MGNMIGRKNEVSKLLKRYESKDAEFVAIYGRRRVGKTYLVDHTFEGKFDFRHTGLSPIELKQLKEQDGNRTYLYYQLEHFYHSLKLYGMKSNRMPKDWFEAFFMLEQLLMEKSKNKRLLVFIDELPWLETPKSFFATALESFWNGWAANKNIMLVVCGSATAWMLDHLINNHGGLYGRVTCEIHVSPFNLAQTEQLLIDNHVNYSKYDIVQTYMIFGGIPFYLKYLEPSLSLASNVDKLFFDRNAPLANEYERLFASSYEDDALVKRIVKCLYTRKVGLKRDEIANECKIKDGERFSKAINALLANDCIIKYRPLQEKGNLYYRLTDPFCLFYLDFVSGCSSLDYSVFSDNVKSQKIISWRGLSFENVCFQHINQIKGALDIRSIESSYSSFNVKGDKNKSGAQIDLVLIRNDNFVNLCEMKFYSNLYSSSKDNHLDLVRKKEVLSSFIMKKQHIHTVLITTYGLKENEYRWDYENVITIDDLFNEYN